VTDARLQAALVQAPFLSIRGVVTRFVFEKRRARATSPAGSAKIGGRFNPAGTEALYTSFSRATALAEFTQNYTDADPIAVASMLSLLVQLDRVIDLTNSQIQESLETSESALTSVRIPRAPHIAERIGSAANVIGADGLIAPSAQAPGTKNLVIFPRNATHWPPYIVVGRL
jgi:RES domain-containing protein